MKPEQIRKTLNPERRARYTSVEEYLSNKVIE